MARTITYQRGSDSVDVPATPGDRPSQRGGDSVPTWAARYFKINAADLVLGGVPIEPQIGDLIVETVANGSVQVAHAVQPTDGNPVFERVEDWLAFKVHVTRAFEGAEQVTYYPGGHLYDLRTLYAEVDRSAEAQLVAFGGDVRANQAVIRVLRGSASGRLEEVKPGEDLVDIDLLRSGKSTRFRVEKVVSSDHPGFWRLGVIGGEAVPP